MDLKDVIIIAAVIILFTFIVNRRRIKQLKKFSLLDAARNKHKESFIEGLKANKGNVNEVDLSGFTPLILSTLHFGIKEIAEMLLNKGAMLDWTDRYGNTALHYATGKKNKTLVKFFTEKGADKTIKNEDGKTPLDIALEDENEDIITLLK